MTVNNSSGAWVLPPPNPVDNALKLVCFPPAGGGAALYRQWPAALAPELSVYRIQPPGRETRFRENLLTDMKSYVDGLLTELRPHLTGPYAFFGHSMGSLVAFCVAKQLRSDGFRLPEHLIVSAFRSPQAPPMKPIFELPQEEFIQELRDTYDGIPDQLLNEPEVLALTLPIVRADLAVVASHIYSPQPPFECPVTAFGGISDHWVDEAQLMEWNVQTSGGFRLAFFAGNHYYLNPPSELLFTALGEALAYPTRSLRSTE